MGVIKIICETTVLNFILLWHLLITIFHNIQLLLSTKFFKVICCMWICVFSIEHDDDHMIGNYRSWVTIYIGVRIIWSSCYIGLLWLVIANLYAMDVMLNREVIKILSVLTISILPICMYLYPHINIFDYLCMILITLYLIYDIFDYYNV